MCMSDQHLSHQQAVLEEHWSWDFCDSEICGHGRTDVSGLATEVVVHTHITSLNIFFAIRAVAEIPSHPLTCVAWFSYQGVAIQTLLISVELLLMLLGIRHPYSCCDTLSCPCALTGTLQFAECTTMTCILLSPFLVFSAHSLPPWFSVLGWFFLNSIFLLHV